nr:transporter [Halomonas flagellata]
MAVVAMVASGMAQAAPQTFNTALPVAEGNLVLREQFLYRKADDDPSPARRDLRVVGAITVLGYGLTRDLALFGALPYLDKELDLDGPGGQRIERSSRGLGDARLFARYTAFKDDAPGRTFRVAPFLGVETPTGDDDERDRFGRLPQPLQSGSGSWDPLGGVVLTYQTLAYQLDAQFAFQANTEANGFEFGDVAHLDGSFQYRLWPRKLGSGVPGFLYGVLEANLLHRGKNEMNGVRDANSGGTQLFLSPGLQYVTRRWIIEGIVQLPAAQDLNGTALEDDFTTRIGFRINF